MLIDLQQKIMCFVSPNVVKNQNEQLKSASCKWTCHSLWLMINYRREVSISTLTDQSLMLRFEAWQITEYLSEIVSVIAQVKFKVALIYFKKVAW